VSSIQDVYDYYNAEIKDLELTIEELQCRVKYLEQQLEEKSKYADIPSLRRLRNDSTSA